MLGIDDTKHNADEIRVTRKNAACSFDDAIPHDNVAHVNVAMDCEQVVEIEGEDLSKLENSDYLVQFPASPSEDVGEVILTPPLLSEEVQRFILRNLQNMEGRMQEKAIAISKKRNLEGNSANHNSFDALSNPELMIRAVKMGVAFPDNNFSNVDITRELEIVRGKCPKQRGDKM